MCGRYTLTSSSKTLAEAFDLSTPPPVAPRYNIAPSQPIAAIRTNFKGDREFTFMLWGMIPFWLKSPTDKGPRPINARAETLAEKTMFKGPLRHRRCLIPADGFYEWQKVGQTKRPHYIHYPDLRPFAFAGLWSLWSGPNGEELDSCTIVTTAANENIQTIHTRMPVILPPDYYDAWLDPQQQSTTAAIELLQNTNRDAMRIAEVSTSIDNPSNDLPECLEPVV